MLKEKQKELEDKANMFNKPKEATEKESKDALLFKTDLPPLHRKQSTAAKPRKQQAVVTPLQGKHGQLHTHNPTATVKLHF